jgi:hypothetical protein
MQTLQVQTAPWGWVVMQEHRLHLQQQRTQLAAAAAQAGGVLH